jgi:hypothetical protein
MQPPLCVGRSGPDFSLEGAFASSSPLLAVADGLTWHWVPHLLVGDMSLIGAIVNARFRLVCLCALMLLARFGEFRTKADEPLRLPSGEPLICIYYFPHWWEPWRSSDDALRADFRRLRSMGFNTLLVDHEWSQAIDRDWFWLDRTHDIAMETGMFILPWLSATSFGDVNSAARAAVFKTQYKEALLLEDDYGGTQKVPVVHREELIRGGARYVEEYIRRYSGKALLRLRWNGKVRTVVSPSVESGWNGGFDESTSFLFGRWLRTRYGSVSNLNANWGTQFGSFFEVNPRDRLLFDYPGIVAGQTDVSRPVEDHAEFRAEMASDAMEGICVQVRKAVPDTLFLAERPVQYGYQGDRRYRLLLAGAERACDYADIVLVRGTGWWTPSEISALRDRKALTGQKFIFTTRTYSDWDVLPTHPAFQATVEGYAELAEKNCSGLGFYSWNEMVDTHVAFSPTADADKTWTEQRSERAIALLAAITESYRTRVGSGVFAFEGTRSVGNGFSTKIRGPSGMSFVLESSPDLVNWTAGPTNTIGISEVQSVTVPFPDRPSKSFFRARSLSN